MVSFFRDRRSIEWKRRFWRWFSGFALGILLFALVGHFVLRLPVWYQNEDRALTDWEVLLFLGGPTLIAWLIFHQNRPSNPVFARRASKDDCGS